MIQLPLAINVGLPRTGTSSFRAAMRRLGWSVQTDPFDPTRIDLLMRGKVREAIERDVAAGFNFLSEPYYIAADAAAREVRAMGGIALCTLRREEEWKRSVRAYTEGKRERPWLMDLPLTTFAQRVLALAWRGIPCDLEWDAMDPDVFGPEDAPYDAGESLYLCGEQSEFNWFYLFETLGRDWPEPFPHVNAIGDSQRARDARKRSA